MTQTTAIQQAAQKATGAIETMIVSKLQLQQTGSSVPTDVRIALLQAYNDARTELEVNLTTIGMTSAGFEIIDLGPRGADQQIQKDDAPQA